jgi:hypothetical protein
MFRRASLVRPFTALLRTETNQRAITETQGNKTLYGQNSVGIKKERMRDRILSIFKTSIAD